MATKMYLLNFTDYLMCRLVNFLYPATCNVQKKKTLEGSQGKLPCQGSDIPNDSKYN